MGWVAGADGCKRGWFRASRDTGTGELCFHLLEEAAELLRRAPRPEWIGLDMPIGLPEAGPRECDRRARACLGRPRSASVFPAPIRAALRARTREEASRITARRDGRRVGAQAWALYRKVRAVDELLAASAQARRRIREVHPEVSFWAWNGHRALRAGKRSGAGREERRRLVEGWLGAGVLAAARGKHARSDVADDDILDALAALWTATRIAEGRARTLPEDPPLDATGLPMAIVY
jgi:predicted RNase H-like nuclease